jgi:hypothetical protein
MSPDQNKNLGCKRMPIEHQNQIRAHCSYIRVLEKVKSEMVLKVQIFLTLKFLLMYNSCTGGFIVTFSYMYTMHPSLVHPLHYYPSSLPPSEYDFDRFQCFIFTQV